MPAQEIPGDRDDRVIRYRSSVGLADPLARLERRRAGGAVKLPYAPDRGYLDALLRLLEVPVSSQCLVFSKTSLQKDRIGPASPRAIYFTDRVFVAWVPGAAAIEVVSVDPVRGPIFYEIGQTPRDAPRPVRADRCFQCHLGPKTRRFPGLLLRSVRTDADGTARSDVLDFVNGHGAPLAERWGGWYVTGSSANDRHRGNVAGVGPDDTGAFAGTGVTDLRRRFDTSRYLSPHSDIVALLVLEHTVGMLNRIFRAGYEARLALDARRRGAEPAARARERIGRAAEDVLEYLLMRGEAPLQGEVLGTSAFAREFSARGPFDRAGRTLRQFDLRRRLFRVPCSYLVYSEAFGALPSELKARIFARLAQVVSGRDRSAVYAGMAAADRKAVGEVLQATLPAFAAARRAAGA